MKGPILFIASLTATAALGMAIVAPAREEAAGYRARLFEAEVPRSEMAVLADKSINALASGIGLDRGTGDPRAERIDEIVGKLEGKDRRDVAPGTVEFTVAADRVPQLLDIVRYRSAPVLTSLTGEALEEGERYRVTLLFAPVPSGFTTH